MRFASNVTTTHPEINAKPINELKNMKSLYVRVFDAFVEKLIQLTDIATLYVPLACCTIQTSRFREQTIQVLNHQSLRIFDLGRHTCILKNNTPPFSLRPSNTGYIARIANCDSCASSSNFPDLFQRTVMVHSTNLFIKIFYKHADVS